MTGATALTPGGNTVLAGPDARAEITAAGTAIDVSAVLLTAARKVRGDIDLVFYNHPAQDGITVNGPVVTADLGRIPPEVQTVAVIASIDADRLDTVFNDASGLRIDVISGGAHITYEPPAPRHGETVVILAELYRRGDAWKLRAVGQGYASGLAGLAQDFGVTVDDPGDAAGGNQGADAAQGAVPVGPGSVPSYGAGPVQGAVPPAQGPGPSFGAGPAREPAYGAGPAGAPAAATTPTPTAAPGAAVPPPPPPAPSAPAPAPVQGFGPPPRMDQPWGQAPPPVPPQGPPPGWAPPPPGAPAAPLPPPYAPQPPPVPAGMPPMPPTGPGAPAGAAPAISLEKVERAAPGLVSLYKQAGISLQKRGISGQRAAVYLVLDHSASMKSYYRSGTMQHLAEQVLGLSANLDDDGIVPVVVFSSRVDLFSDISLDNHGGRVEALHHNLPWGGTCYAPAMRAVIDHYQGCGATDPAFVVFQSDGEPFDRGETKRLLQQTSTLPIFWQFVGFGGTRLKFLRTLDTLKGRTLDNAGFFAAGRDPRERSDGELYDCLMAEFPSWLAAARQAGIVR